MVAKENNSIGQTGYCQRVVIVVTALLDVAE